MKLSELLTEFENLDFVYLVGRVDLNADHVSFEDKAIFPNLELFEVPFIEKQGNTMIKRTEWVYVKDRGTEVEVAAWKDSYPQPTTRGNNIKQKYYELIEQNKGMVLEEGDNYIVIQAYELNDEGKYEQRKYLVDEDGTITEVV